MQGRFLGLVFAMAGSIACGGCGGTKTTPPDMSPPADLLPPAQSCIDGTAKTSKYVINALKMPAKASDYALDLNGDNLPDNHLGDIVNILKTQNIDLQASSAMALEQGELLMLLDYKAAGNLDEDTCAQTTISGGAKPASPPLLDGTDVLTVDSTLTAGTFVGATKNMLFNSSSPLTTTTPVTFTLKIPLAIGSPPVKLRVTAGQITFVHVNGRLSQGQIHGAVKKTQFDDEVMPALTALLNQEIAANVPSKQMILDQFDTGNCNAPDGTPAVAKDGKIDLCEVSTNALVQLVLNADVALFDSAGNYAPDPTNNTPDSVSIGLGFTAIGASF